MFGLRVDPQPPVDHFYEGEGPLRFGRYTVRVRHTPGHCPGGVCLAVQQGGRAEGDAVRRRHALRGLDRPHRSAGRRSARRCCGRSARCLFSYPDDTVVWSGHGEQTTIGRERRTNPFLIQ